MKFPFSDLERDGPPLKGPGDHHADGSEQSGPFGVFGVVFSFCFGDSVGDKKYSDGISVIFTV